MHLAQLMAFPGVVKNPLRGGGLACINMGNDAYIARFLLSNLLAHYDLGFSIVSLITTDNAQKPCWLRPFGELLLFS